VGTGDAGHANDSCTANDTQHAQHTYGALDTVPDGADDSHVASL
jgi:hypothetical protein